MHRAFRSTEHRPWPCPERPWTWRQSWHDLLFAHWPISVDALRPLVPEPLVVQEFDGTSWIGVVPFRMTGVMRRPLPDLPGISAFPELNVRVYVEHEGKPGVWFLSLDAANSLAVWAARRYFFLPYWRARMSLVESKAGIFFRSQRVADKSVHFHSLYSATSKPQRSEPGTIEHFLTERYCLYTQSPAGKLYRCEVHHVPWPLQTAEGTIEATALLAAHGLSVSGDPLLHFARRLDVVVWGLEPIDS